MSLRDSAVKGVFWTGIGTVGGGLLNFILTMILARVLSPSDYGLLELLAIFTILSECFVDSGFSQAIIKDQNASQTDLSSVFFFNLIISLVLYVGLFFAAPLIADFYHEPELTKLSRFVFLVIVFHSCSIIQNAIFSKNLQFKPLAIASIVAIIISGTIAGIMAFKGFGVWALATNMVLFAFLKMVFYWIFSSWKPSFVLSFKSIKKYLKFGVDLLVQGLVDKFVTNIESLMIGRVYTKTDLGFFSQARKLDSYIMQTSTSVVQKVTYPILAKLCNKNDLLKTGYRRVIGITMFAMVPLSFFVVASADNLLFVLFGPQWDASVPYLRLWGFCGLLVSFYSVFINIFLVTNNTRQLLYLSLIRQCIRLGVIILFIKVSIMALMYGIVLVSFVYAIMYCYFGGRLIGYKISEVISDILPTVIIAFIGAINVFFIGKLLMFYNHYIVFALQFFTMLVVFWMGSFFIKNKSYIELNSIIKSLIKSLANR